MKTMKLVAILLIAFAFTHKANAADVITKEKKTAETVFAFASSMETFDAEVLKAEIKDLSVSEKVKLANMAIADVKQAEVSGASNPPVGLYVLALFLPPVAVGIHTDWEMPTVYNFIWTCCGGLPGIIHAFIVLSR